MDVIKDLSIERDILYANKELNLDKIYRCDCLIDYYCSLYSRWLEMINEKKDILFFYENIIAFKEMIRSPQFLEHIRFISDKHLVDKISILDYKISKLYSESEMFRGKTIFYIKKKLMLEAENVLIDDRINVIEYDINHSKTLRR